MQVKHSLLVTAIALTPYLVNAESNDLNSKVEALSKEIAELKAQVAESPSAKIKGTSFGIYGSIRPTLEYRTEEDNPDGDNYFDQRDALSQLGFKGDIKINEDITAFFKSEWSIALQDGGDFGQSRQVFAGLETSIGTAAIGKQRPVQYLYIAEYIDIFNHSSSPFAYDFEGSFFVDNMITYQNKFDNFSVHAGAKFDGRSGENNADFVNYGVAYDYNNLHLAVTYLDKTSANGLNEGEATEIIGFGAAYSVDDLYFALGYQDISKKTAGAINSESSYTADIVAAYQLPKNFKLKAGYFLINDDLAINSLEFDGYNLTLENQLSPNVRVHVEYLTRDFDDREDFQSISIGVRYDFALSF
jgi:predicted porin